MILKLKDRTYNESDLETIGGSRLLKVALLLSLFSIVSHLQSLLALLLLPDW